MGNIDEFSFTIRAFLKLYRWRRIDPVPWTPLRKPLAQSRLILASSAGFVLPSQKPFDHEVRGGDPTLREIPGDADVSTLIDTHRSEAYDHTGLRQDQNLGFPLDRLRELVKSGRIGSLAPRHLSFMGSITAPGRFVRDTVPAAVRAVVTDGPDVALVIPVCPMCNQAACLVAAEFERQGVSGVVLQLLREVAEKVHPPRALFVPYHHGYPLGEPHNSQLQLQVIEAALRLLEDPSLTPPAIRDFQLAA